METVSKLVWKGLDDQTYEHCTLQRRPGQLVVNSKIEGPVNNQHIIVEYDIVLDNNWTVNSVELKLINPEQRSIKLTHNKYGEWVDGTLHPRPDLDGCIDIDISLTPFTNSLPVKRLCFKPGESRDITVVYFDLPSLDVNLRTQRYTFLGDNLFRFEALDTKYTNEISFTPGGFVQHYPGLFELSL